MQFLQVLDEGICQRVIIKTLFRNWAFADVLSATLVESLAVRENADLFVAKVSFADFAHCLFVND